MPLPICLEKRTSGAKAQIGAVFFGTAEAVPFVKSVFPIWLKALTNLIGAARLKAEFITKRSKFSISR
jgi:hypothetical protein